MPSASDLLFAQLLVSSELLTRERAQKCLREISDSEGTDLRKHLGDVILEKEFLAEKLLRNAFSLMTRFPYEVRRRGERVGPYTILRQLGKGGMGPCYEAAHVQRPQETVVLKTLPKMMATVPELRERFFRCVVKGLQCRHENLGRIMDADQSRGVYFVVQELVPGQSLGTVLDHMPMLDESQAREIVIQSALGLKKLAEMGICHGNLKPNNIQLSHSGLVKIVDIGLDAFSGWGDPLTQPSGIWGTPYYSPPEFGRPGAERDIRSDLYSLGVIFYEMLTGGVPFSGSIPILDLRRRLTEPWPDPCAKNPKISDNAIEILNRLTQMNPAERYSDIESLLADLESTMGGRKNDPPLNGPESTGEKDEAGLADTRVMKKIDVDAPPDADDEPDNDVKPDLAPEVDDFYEKARMAETHGEEKIGTRPMPASKSPAPRTSTNKNVGLDGSQELVALLQETEKLQATETPVKHMHLQVPDEPTDEEPENEPEEEPLDTSGTPLASSGPSPLILVGVSAVVTLALALLVLKTLGIL